MALIHNPLDDMRTWLDAFTVYMEVQAEANTSPQMRSRLKDAIAQLTSAVAAEADEGKQQNLRNAMQTQQSILDSMQKFDLDAFHEIMARWRTVRSELVATNWDLRVPINFEKTAKGGFVVFQTKAGSSIYWNPAEAQLGIAFFRWMDQMQKSPFNPVEHTKQMLLAQGITADNFHLHADKLAIENPWAPSRIITGGLDLPTKGF